MIVVVEGIDRVGKSTFVEMLRKSTFSVLNAKIRHPDVGKSISQLIQNERIFAQLEVLKMLKYEDVVIDRFHLSQFVYGCVERNNIDTSMWEVDAELAKLGAILVYVEPTDIDFSSARHGKSLEEHHSLFNAAINTTKMKVIKTNFNNLEDALKEVHAEWHRRYDNGNQG